MIRKYYIQFCNPIILLILLFLGYSTCHILNNLVLTTNGFVLVLYVIIYVYEVILITLYLNPKKVIHLTRSMGHDISMINNYWKIQIFFTIIGCVPPIILLII